ncbi:hypothetical protein [Arthrobacter sp. AFG20]|uniref:hypothetical protein n=1 Tax=Arthrobacter sp. AFG20 TaxID=1688671 RepID=UPI0011AFC0F9|nr:hypothetical protein [Arthrobacter sp. AFG20]
MANKSRRRRQKNRKPRSGHPAGKPASRAVSAASHQRDQELGSLFAFVDWHREHGILPELVFVLAQLQAFFPLYAELSGGAAVTAMDPGLIAQHVELLEERDPEYASFFCAVLFEYMPFLRHTGRWSGTDERHQVLHDVLYHGILNEDISPAGWPRTQAGSSRQASRRSA